MVQLPALIRPRQLPGVVPRPLLRTVALQISGVPHGQLQISIPVHSALRYQLKTPKLLPESAYVDYFSITVSYSCTPPAQPGNITGPTSVCPGTTGLSYSIISDPEASSYNWSVPSGWSITSGNGTASITTTSGTTGGDISVTAN